MHRRADNCNGQNKNRFMIAYLCWRVLAQLHSKITLSFLPVGHTKFYPDLGFGLFKRHLKTSTVSTMQEVVECINSSTPLSHALHAQLVANEDGDIVVSSYDWQEKLGNFRAIPQLKKYHHFVFSDTHPGVVHCYADSSDKAGETFVVCSPNSLSGELPSQLCPRGLSSARKEYLFKKIRPFCPDHAKDILCPGISQQTGSGVVEQNEQPSLPGPSHESSCTTAAEHIPAPTRKTQKFSFGLQVGHRNAVCNGIFLCPVRKQNQVS